MESIFDSEIDEKSQQREEEEIGLTIGIQLIAKDKIIGTLERHEPNKLFVRTKDDRKRIKEIHRSLVERFMIILDGGKDGSSN